MPECYEFVGKPAHDQVADRVPLGVPIATLEKQIDSKFDISVFLVLFLQNPFGDSVVLRIGEGLSCEAAVPINVFVGLEFVYRYDAKIVAFETVCAALSERNSKKGGLAPWQPRCSTLPYGRRIPQLGYPRLRKTSSAERGMPIRLRRFASRIRIRGRADRLAPRRRKEPRPQRPSWQRSQKPA